MNVDDRDHDAPPTLAEQLVELSTLTGGLAHEIRNPLSTLKVNLQLLDEDWRQIESGENGSGRDVQDVARRSRKRLTTLLTEADRLERILADFLEYVGQRELRRQPHDLNEIVRELAEFFRPQTERGRVDLHVETGSVPLVCRADAGVLKQALLNLLINAQQAMPDGGTLTMRVAPAGGGRARIDVEDTGPGVPTELREKVFEAFYSARKGGTGLGLATARRMIEQHGGSISVAGRPPSAVGAVDKTGSRFSILLPIESRGAGVSPAEPDARSGPS